LVNTGSEAAKILESAAQRGKAMGLPYAGAVTPREAHELREAGAAVIVDVRTQPEWQFVGHVPDAPLIEWPRGGAPEQFDAFLREVQARFKPEEKLLLLCRSGVRSHHAAELLARSGYPNAYNVLEGFEGEQGLGANGWRTAGLPWKKG
jgi:rhodanese-related sulfurtransferase